jgi:hypothetical protein
VNHSWKWVAGWGAAFLSALVVACGTNGLVHAALYAAAVAPGIALGRRVAGARHPAGWVIGTLLGYGATQLALWLPIYLGVASPVTFLLSWLLHAALLVWLSRRIDQPVLALPSWSPGDTRALALTLLLVPLLMGPPYRNLGAIDESGTRWYRAYFTADFVWHTALAAELGRHELPPRNPYMASQPMHYYWTYFLLPSVAARDDLQGVLKANAMVSAPWLIAMMYLLARTAVPRAGPAAGAVALVILATSAEGAFSLYQLWERGAPVATLAEANIDAISAWEFKGLRIDGIARGLWYNPQHSMACALGLIAALIAATSGVQARREAIWLAGAALGLAMTFNPFVGAMFSAIYGIAVMLDAISHPGVVRAVGRHTQAAVPVVLALAWCSINEVAGAAVAFGWRIGNAGHNTIGSLLISAGPVLLPAAAGLWAWTSLPARPLRVAATGAVLSLLLMHTMTLSEPSWVGFRTGQILQLMLPVLLARVLWMVRQVGRTWVAALLIAVLAAGLPTTAIDTYNAQDVGNRRMGPGFHWTQGVTAPQQRAFEWIRRSLPQDAVVQMEPVIRGEEQWSLIPTFAQRRMSAGLPISLLPTPEYERGSREVQQLYRTTDPKEACEIAHRRGIEYLYVDALDRTAYPEGIAKFDLEPACFERAYDRRGITIYRVSSEPR